MPVAGGFDTGKPTGRRRRGAAVAWALALGLLAAPAAGGTSELYRWTDEDGNVHYSDSLPANRAPDARDVYDRAGRHLERVDAALSEQERALQRERQRQERETEALRRQRAQEQARYDRMLRRTYTSLAAVHEARDARLENLESSISLARNRMERYREELDRLREDAAREERRAGGNVAPIHARIQEIRGRLERQEAFIAERRADMEAIRENFARHAERFRELQAADSD